MNMTQNDTVGASAPREIPVPPGGGSWTFDESSWKWVSNDPVPAQDAAADAADHVNDQEQ